MKYELTKVSHAVAKHYGTQTEMGKTLGLAQAAVSFALKGDRDKTLKLIIDHMIENNGYVLDDFMVHETDGQFEQLMKENEELRELINKLQVDVSLIKQALANK